MSTEMKKRGDIRAGAVLRTYLRAAWEHPWLLSLSVASAIGAQIAGVIGPLYLKDIINVIAASAPTQRILSGLLVTLGIFSLIQVVSWALGRTADFSISNIELRAMNKLYNAAREKLLRHSHEFFISNFSGSLTRRVTRYARAFERVWDYIIYNAVPTVVYMFGTVVVLASQNLMLGVGLLAWSVGFIVLQIYLVQRLQPLRIAANEADSAVAGEVSDSVVNHLAITTFSAFAHERDTFANSVNRLEATSRASWMANIRLNSLLMLFNIAFNIVLIGGAIFYWQQGVLTVGDFMLIQMYVMGLMNRIWNVGRNIRQLYEAFAEATEMLDIIELTPDIVDKPDAKALAVSEGDIVFDRVRFAYHEGQNVLSDFDLHIAPHEKVALVGLSGAGKTTITKLLLRLYDIQDGAIRIDGQSIADVTQESVRRAIAFVPQEPVLFHRTLMENIRYGRAGATDEEVIAAAKQAHCYEFISHYPEGFETMVGERGVKLSGGERQRVAIARAILKNAPILVLDEATSSLDSESEHLIQDALTTLMEGKTVIAVAHRLSTVMKMDRIIVMEQGAVTLSGTHDALLSHEENLYKKLWEIQAGGFLDTAPASSGVV
ncbi:MAG TPA: ABC transporter ATP-binding protein [Candidatus Paceibacterota bacterium]